MRVAVVAAQGAVAEHVRATKTALDRTGLDGSVIAARHKEDVARSDAIILPGGESTTISKLIHRSSVATAIKRAARRGVPVMGTCAGSILLATRGDSEVQKTQTVLLALMDIAVRRNAFGRQRESFQATVDFKSVGRVDAVFIRAPAITAVGDTVDVLARLDDRIVATRQDNLLAVVFHPELTDDTRVHEYFLRMAG
jgi:5'-phosphate synthase pdxT subunit